MQLQVASCGPLYTRGPNNPSWDCIFSKRVSVELPYIKASRYTASSCTDLAGARFWIQFKKIWDEKPWAARFFDHLALTLLSNKSCTNLSWTSFFFPQKTCISRPYYTDFFGMHSQNLNFVYLITCSWHQKWKSKA